MAFKKQVVMVCQPFHCLHPHISPKLFGEPIITHNLVQRKSFVQVQVMTLFVKQNADKEKNKNKKTTFWVISPSSFFFFFPFFNLYDRSSLILWGAEIRLWSAVIILWCGIIVTVMVIVVLGGGVVVVMVVMVTLDVSIGKKEGRRGRWWLLGRCHPCCQRCITLDGAIPTRCSWLGCGGQKTESGREHIFLNYKLTTQY